jgi:hypothetical protein
MNTEIIRFARAHRYALAEGFCDQHNDKEFKTALDNLPEDCKSHLDIWAAELSKAAGVTFDEAYSAYVNWLFKKEHERLSGANN